MLRPATPLSILLFASFILLLLSTLSTPIIKGLPLARYQNVNFGVFGWCKDDGSCSPIRVGWNAGDALADNADADFNLPANARHSLSSLLVVHPVAAFLNLIALALAIAAHLHSPSHSARYLLGLLIFLLPTLLITLLAFLVDILLFVPHIPLRAGWIVLASTILITVSGVVTCAMRRTLVSRKARKKRIAENAEMSGENFYTRQAQEAKVVGPTMSTESKAPLVHGTPGAENLPAFSTYNPAQRMDDRQGQPRNGPHPDSFAATSPVEGNDRFYSSPVRSNSGPRAGEFGTPMGPSRSQEDRRPPGPYPPRGSYGPPRGRGGYPPRGAMGARGGGYGPRGPPPQAYGRGGHPGRGRGGYGPPMVGRGPSQRNGPPPGYPPQGNGMPPDRYSRDDMGGPLPPGGVVPYVRPDQPNYEPTSPSAYSDGRNSMPVYRARSQSPANGQRSPSPPPDMPPLPAEAYANHGPEPTLPVLPPQSEEYVPPRAGWSNAQPSNTQGTGLARVNSGGSDYMEDVDPRFAQAQAEDQPALPNVLAAGRVPKDPSPESSSNHIVPATSYENLHGARSPAGSETSEFTSISQRGVNPNWRPGHGGEFNSFGPMKKRHQQQRQDALFQNNPDFEIPGMGPPRSGQVMNRGPGPMRGGNRGSMGQGPPRMPPPGAGDGRYPVESPPPPAPGMIKEI